jgi:Immunity protein 63
MPVHEQPQHDGSSHIEISENGYALVATDRGSETARRETRELDELLYWIAKGEASGRGLEYELEHRNGTDDFRRVYFAKAEEDLSLVSREWAERLRRDHAMILGSSPFLDDPFGEL